MAQVADPEEGLRVETASRLEWDRDRWLRRPLDAAVSPVKADSDFMSKLLFLLRKVGCPVYPGGLVHLPTQADGISWCPWHNLTPQVWQPPSRLHRQHQHLDLAIGRALQSIAFHAGALCSAE